MPYIDVHEDQKGLTIAFDQAKPVPVVVEHTTEMVDKLLSVLGGCRSALLPPIPEKWVQSQEIMPAVRDPKLHLEIESLNGDPVLHIRHPHFGWLHFVFSRDEAVGLGRALIVRANAEPPAPAGRA